MPFLSQNQIILSTQRLSELHPFFGFAFIGLKKYKLPVEDITFFSYNYIHQEILEKYFRPLPKYLGFFSPFSSSNPDYHWVNQRYASTSLQRVMTDTFGEAFLHQKGTSEWGWRFNYLEVLEGFIWAGRSSRIPVLDLAVWLYRDRELTSEYDAVEQLLNWFDQEFGFTPAEYETLCATDMRNRQLELAPQPPASSFVMNTFGWPNGALPETGVYVGLVKLKNVGPTQELAYAPSSRLNLIVGDNSVGKTFLLETVWWVLTGKWNGYAAEPKDRGYRRSSEIAWELSSASGYSQSSIALFDSYEQAWRGQRGAIEGFGFYARFDGTYALWDSLRPLSERWRSVPPVLAFDKDQIWNGLAIAEGAISRRYICNGLISDLVRWSGDDGLGERSRLLSLALRTIARGTEIRGLGKPVEIPGDSRLMPTVRMPYGDVPVVYASAGTQRALTIAYLLVWGWTEHAALAGSLNREPYKTVVVVLDELEAHLHPKWQRSILPALMEMVGAFAPGVEPQFHIATHSPLVMASVEPDIDAAADAVHTLSLRKNSVVLQKSPFVRQGTVDAWLTSSAFDLLSPRSERAQKAIARASSIQQQKHPEISDVVSIHRELQETLPDDDDFWIRWNYFKEKILAENR